LQLLPEYFSHTEAIEQKKMLGCYSLMLGFEQALNIDWDAALISEADISWISVNSSKSGRPKNYSLLVHSTNDWAENHLDDASEAVIKHLCSEVQMITGQDVSMAQHIDLHRWRYANISRQAKSKPFIDNAIKIAACGDWCAKGRIEAAFRSGFDLAKEMRMLLK
jgi:predicted NAD/FAD-dependent oxidoreductase